jgi:hypothetical protein
MTSELRVDTSTYPLDLGLVFSRSRIPTDALREIDDLRVRRRWVGHSAG